MADSRIDLMIGWSADRFVAYLPNLLPQLATVRFVRYVPSPGVAERLSLAAKDEHRKDLEVLRRTAPRIFERFADSFAFQSARDSSPDFALAEMLSHDSSSEHDAEHHVDAAKLLERRSAGIDAKPYEALGVSSRCVLRDGSQAHIPMLDFRLAISAQNLNLVERAMQQLGIGRAVFLDSGRSYHAYGLCVMTDSDWRRFLYRALLLSPIIDVRYVAHRLLANQCVLRINAAPSKPAVPHVVSVYGLE